MAVVTGQDVGHCRDATPELAQKNARFMAASSAGLCLRHSAAANSGSLIARASISLIAFA